MNKKQVISMSNIGAVKLSLFNNKNEMTLFWQNWNLVIGHS